MPNPLDFKGRPKGQRKNRAIAVDADIGEGGTNLFAVGFRAVAVPPITHPLIDTAIWTNASRLVFLSGRE